MKEVDYVNRLNGYLEDIFVPYANEVRMGIGIPDIMLGAHIPPDYETIMDYYLLKTYDFMLSNKHFTVKELIQSSGFPKTNIKKYICMLEEKNIVNVVNAKINIIKYLKIGFSGKNISIEVKIKDWRMGIGQAQRYLSFSDYSYLAMPEKYISNVSFEHIKSSGVGLLSINENTIDEIVAPTKSQQCNPLLKYISISTLVEKMGSNFSSKNNDFDFTSLWHDNNV